MKRAAVLFCFAAMLTLCLASPAWAETVQISAITVSANQGSGLEIGSSPNFPTQPFNVTTGAPVTVNAFKIWTPETSVNADDRVPRAITVTFAFALPTGMGGSIGGQTVGVSLLGLVQYGQVTWGGPLIIDLGNGTALQITLSDAVFSAGVLGLGNRGADISATFALINSPQATPEPTTALLLGSGIALLAGLRKRLWSH